LAVAIVFNNETYNIMTKKKVF